MLLAIALLEPAEVTGQHQSRSNRSLKQMKVSTKSNSYRNKSEKGNKGSFSESNKEANKKEKKTRTRKSSKRVNSKKSSKRNKSSSSAQTPFTSEKPTLAPTPVYDETEAIEILTYFYDETNGNNWTRNAGWRDDNIHPCFWFGIDCSNGMIDKIDLQNNNIVGKFSELRLTELRTLTWLNLFQNQLEGSINSEIAQMAHLEHLDLGVNFLTGTIPAEIGELYKLQGVSIIIF